MPDGAVPPFLNLAAHPLRWQLLTELAQSDLRVRELVALLGQPQNLVSYHLRLLREGGLVAARRSSADGRDSYYRLDLDRCAQALAGAGAALHPSLGQRPPAPEPAPPVPDGLSVLFACTGNSARSPVAEALLRQRTDGRVRVASGGSRPKPELHPAAVRVLREDWGIDLADRRPRDLRAEAGSRFDYVITLCDKVREVCPDFPGPARRVHWSIPDPAVAGAADDAPFRAAVAEIDGRIRHLLPALSSPHR